MLNEKNIASRKRVIDKMHFSKADTEIVEAIFLKEKIQDLDLPAVTIETDVLMEKILIFYGVKEKELQIYKDMKAALPLELKKYYNEFTLEEIKLGINIAIRGGFGDIKSTFTVSLKMFREMINAYSQSDLRKKLINEYGRAKEEIKLKPVLSQDEQNKIIVESICYKFSKYKVNKDVYYVGGHDYSALLGLGISLPDFKEFLPLAAEMVKGQKAFRDRKGETQIIGDAMKIAFENTANLEARKMCLTKFYNDLIEKNKELDEFINHQKQ